jgi:hypothetical protein
MNDCQKKGDLIIGKINEIKMIWLEFAGHQNEDVMLSHLIMIVLRIIFGDSNSLFEQPYNPLIKNVNGKQQISIVLYSQGYL